MHFINQGNIVCCVKFGSYLPSFTGNFKRKIVYNVFD